MLSSLKWSPSDTTYSGKVMDYSTGTKPPNHVQPIEGVDTNQTSFSLQWHVSQASQRVNGNYLLTLLTILNTDRCFRGLYWCFIRTLSWRIFVKSTLLSRTVPRYPHLVSKVLPCPHFTVLRLPTTPEWLRLTDQGGAVWSASLLVRWDPEVFHHLPAPSWGGRVGPLSSHDGQVAEVGGPGVPPLLGGRHPQHGSGGVGGQMVGWVGAYTSNKHLTSDKMYSFFRFIMICFRLNWDQNHPRFR